MYETISNDVFMDTSMTVVVELTAPSPPVETPHGKGTDTYDDNGPEPNSEFGND